MGNVEQFLQSLIGIALCCLGITIWLIVRHTKETSPRPRAMWICIGNMFLMQGLYRTVKGGLLNLGTGSQYWLLGGCFLSALAVVILALHEQKKGSEVIEREKARVPSA